MPFVSPFPIDCGSCDSEIVSDDIYDIESRRNRYRYLYVECSDCGTQYKIEQNHPLDPEPDILEVEE